MVGKMPNDPDRRVRDRRQPLAEFGKDPRLDMAHQTQEHVIEQRDLLGTVLVRMAQKEVGHAPQRYNALVARPGLDRLVQLSKQGMAHAHRMPLPGDRNEWLQTCAMRFRKDPASRSRAWHPISLRLWG